MRAESGAIPPAAQKGLREGLRCQGYFLSCVCVPQEDIRIARPDATIGTRTRAVITLKQRLNADILRLKLQCVDPFEYRAGQFVQLRREDGLTRSYSISSLPDGERPAKIELHVRRLPGGQMTEWIHESLAEGDSIEVAGPTGECFYLPGAADQPLLLVGTGSGLAPLWGIAQDALRQGHTGDIHLYHGSWTFGGLYLVEELRRLDGDHSNFHYHACVDTFAEDEPGFVRQGRADQLAFADQPQLKGWRVFFCGHPDLVAGGKKRAFLLGASLKEIFADPFVLSKR
jgi:NAD(P)H-flavin reductase